MFLMEIIQQLMYNKRIEDKALKMATQDRNIRAWSSLRYKIRTRRLNIFYRKWIERFCVNKGMLLDIGCGDGSFISYMKNMGWDVYGVVINSAILKNTEEALRPKIKVINGDLGEADFGEDSFDVVTLWNVFEHIRDSDNLLRAIKKVLRKDGLLVMQVPNTESLEARIFKKNWIHLDLERHAHHFSTRTLSAPLNKTGFKITAITHHSPIDKYYRGSFENLLRAKLRIGPRPYFFHSIFYKMALDFLFVPITIAGNLVKKGTFITVACMNEK